METRFRSRRKRYVARDVQEDEGKVGAETHQHGVVEPRWCSETVQSKTEFKGTKYSFRVIVFPKMIDCLMSRTVACRMGLIKKIEMLRCSRG